LRIDDVTLPHVDYKPTTFLRKMSSLPKSYPGAKPNIFLRQTDATREK